MVKERFLLCEDAGTEETRLLQNGVTRGVPGAPTPLPAAAVLPACEPKKPHGHHHDHDDDDDDD
jgi:hypothetical protein